VDRPYRTASVCRSALAAYLVAPNEFAFPAETPVGPLDAAPAASAPSTQAEATRRQTHPNLDKIFDGPAASQHNV